MSCDLCQDRGFLAYDRDDNPSPLPCLRCGKTGDPNRPKRVKVLFGDAMPKIAHLKLPIDKDGFADRPLTDAEIAQVEVEYQKALGKTIHPVVRGHLSGKCGCWK